MDRLIELVAGEWSVVSAAPLTFLLLATSMFAVAFVAARWRYSAIVDQKDAANETIRERLGLKAEQMEHYRERAISLESKVSEVVESDSESLSGEALQLVASIRSFIDQEQARSHQIQETEWAEMSNATDEGEKRKLWTTFTNALTEASGRLMADWERRFKVDAIVLRDELRGRLSDYVPNGHVDQMYETPTNFFGLNDVAADLERMAKILVR